MPQDNLNFKGSVHLQVIDPDGNVKPTSSSTSIPDTYGKENREVIVHGALYRLQMMSGQPFS